MIGLAATVPDPQPLAPRIRPREFALLRDLIHRESGIFLSDAKKALVVARLGRRLRELGLKSFGDYYRRLADGDEQERTRMLDCICTYETHFFREPRQFEFLERQLVPEWTARAAAGGPRRIRAWSAGCSTGEEPCSLAMVLLAHFPASAGWSVEVLASDLSSRALERARAGLWTIEKASEIPQRYLKAFMLRGRGSQEGLMKAGPEIRSLLRFQRVNLSEDRYPVAGPFELVFCRNVLIYFDPVSKARVVERLLDQLVPGGYLFLGHAESLTGLSERGRSVGPTVYVRAGEPRPLAS
ncbi:MAG TPA: protein-glutamate O-methyltransferase CheR [Vicinamibacteria bacterium]|nr:protein-glutamate O-methyltransferase CheR [Vicinamibacteria bacterium]